MADLKRLIEPFPAESIEWRIGQCGTKSDGSVWAKVLAYVTNRAIMDRLDEVCGPDNWRNEFREWKCGEDAGVLCGISIRIQNEWVTKWDGAENTDIESVKGGLSSAMKRAAVQWGIGRYLYDLEEGWATVSNNGKHYAKTKDGKSFHWSPPLLPEWALPAGTQPAKTNPVNPPKTQTNGKSSPEDAKCKALLAADSLDALHTFWTKSLSAADRKNPAIVAAKDKRKQRLTLDAIDDFAKAHKFRSDQIILLESTLNIDLGDCTAEQATTFFDAMKAECASRGEVTA